MDHSEIRFKPQRKINRTVLNQYIHGRSAGPSSTVQKNIAPTNTADLLAPIHNQPIRNQQKHPLDLQLGYTLSQVPRGKDKNVAAKVNNTAIGVKPSISGRPALTPRDDLSKTNKKPMAKDFLASSSSQSMRNFKLRLQKMGKMDLDEENQCKADSVGTINPCLKLATVLAQVILLISGFMLIVLGICTLADRAFTYKLFGNSLYVHFVYVLIGTGCSLTLVAVMGCIGSIKECKYLMKLNALILAVTFFGMMMGLMAALIYRNYLRHYVAESMLALIGSYATDEEVHYAWDATQQNLHCCGVFSVSDWPRDAVPASCCRGNNCTAGEVYPSGCFGQTFEFLRGHNLLIFCVYMGAVGILLNGLLTSCAFQSALSEQDPP